MAVIISTFNGASIDEINSRFHQTKFKLVYIHIVNLWIKESCCTEFFKLVSLLVGCQERLWNIKTPAVPSGSLEPVQAWLNWSWEITKLNVWSFASSIFVESNVHCHDVLSNEVIFFESIWQVVFWFAIIVFCVKTETDYTTLAGLVCSLWTQRSEHNICVNINVLDKLAIVVSCFHRYILFNFSSEEITLDETSSIVAVLKVLVGGYGLLPFIVHPWAQWVFLGYITWKSACVSNKWCHYSICSHLHWVSLHTDVHWIPKMSPFCLCRSELDLGIRLLFSFKIESMGVITIVPHWHRSWESWWISICTILS